MNCQQANQVQVYVDLNEILSKSGGKAKESILKEILTSIHALLNTDGGGTLELLFNDQESEAVGKFIRMIEQKLISSIGTQVVTSHITFEPFQDGVIPCKAKKCNTFITTNYNLYVPSETQANLIPATEEIKDTILNRRHVPQPVPIRSHHQIFTINEICGLTENKNTELKCLTAAPSKRTTLADRMTGKGNKFSCYVSAFANHNGGHIYYGIADDGVVEGEFIPNEKDKGEITKKVEKAINKMIWPQQIGQPKRGEHWEIFFEPVVDENSKPVPSTFVIVIYIAPCLGGVFTEKPECYEMVEGKVKKMSFATWKKGVSQPVWLRGKEEIPPSVQRTTWSSAAVRKVFTVESENLRQLINDGNWNFIVKECQILQRKLPLCEMKLLALSKQVTVCYRRGHFKDAHAFLDQYITVLPQVKYILFFEVMGLHSAAALKRASGDFEALKEYLTAALSKAELIKPGLVTAAVYGFAATVSDLIKLEERTNKFSPDVLSIKTLEHSQYVEDSPHFHADKAQKAHIILATFYLGCNLSGQPIKDNIDTSDIDKAKTSIMAVHRTTYEGNPLSKYRQVQLKLVQSIYDYRLSQVRPDKRVCLLRSAFNYAKEAERLSRDCQFREMVEWSKANEALCTEELVRVKFTCHPGN